MLQLMHASASISVLASAGYDIYQNYIIIYQNYIIPNIKAFIF